MITIVADSNGLVSLIGDGNPNTLGVTARSVGYTSGAKATYTDTTAVGSTQRVWTWDDAASAWV